MENLSSMRQNYQKGHLDLPDLDANPLTQFDRWFKEAKEHHVIEANAFCLATVGANALPSTRIVLLKYYDSQGFIFFSNYHSKKALQVSENPNVSMHFAWLALERQIKIEGKIEKISKEESLNYFLARPRGSQIGAWVSHQSEVIASKEVLEAKFEEIQAQFKDKEIPYPEFWGGYRIVPTQIEFWQGGQNRLHDRFQYTKTAQETWEINRLAP